MAEDTTFIHPTADVSAMASVGAGTRIWHQAQVLGGVTIGNDCTLGKGAFVGSGAAVGNLVKIGNYAQVFGATLEDETFVGPNVCILEDRNPRSTNADGTRKGHDDYLRQPAVICRGASLGAASIILPGVTVGRWAMVSAGAVVHRDVPDHAIVGGNPARQLGLACRCGLRLDEGLACTCGRKYRQAGLELIVLPQQQPV